MQQDDSMQSPEDDLVVFNACGITTSWRPPADMLKCTVLNCQTNFQTRSALIRHFNDNHAEGIVCKICDKPIRTHQFDQFVAHYRRMHPFKKVPFTGGDEEEEDLSNAKQGV